MKSANEILKIKKERKQEKLKLETEQINKEMLEVEKTLNTYEKNDEDTNSYIDISIIIKTQTVKDLLKEKGFYIDKVNQDIPYGKTRVYLDKISYDIATRREAHQQLNNSYLKEEDIKDKINKQDDNIKMYFNGAEYSNKDFENVLKLILSKQDLINGRKEF